MEVVFAYAAVLVALWAVFQLVRIVPEQQAFVVEEFGQYKRTLGSGLHFVIPVLQKVSYRHTLKEEVNDVSPQVCITQDNVQVEVDGILYLKVVDPVKASYGIENYRSATALLAQTTMRSEIGKIPLDKTFSEREAINAAIVKSIDVASEPWGVKVTRYEIRDIEPADSVIDAMEKQVEAERFKRAEILESEGDKESRINSSKGEREEAINLSRGERQRRINVAEGQARSIEIVTEANAQGLKMVGEAIRLPGGQNAVSLQVSRQYLDQLGRILEVSEVQMIPPEAARLQGLLTSALPGLQNMMSVPSKAGK
jgi:regulator of protease activity HflC (stomatin/prohibitin superfamily)